MNMNLRYSLASAAFIVNVLSCSEPASKLEQTVQTQPAQYPSEKVLWGLPQRCDGKGYFSPTMPVYGLVPESSCRGGGFAEEMCEGVVGTVQLPPGQLPTARDAEYVQYLDGQLLSELPEECWHQFGVH